MPREWRIDAEGVILVEITTGTNLRGPDQLVILGSFEAASLDSMLDSLLSQRKVHSHGLPVRDLIVSDIQELARALGLPIRR